MAWQGKLAVDYLHEDYDFETYPDNLTTRITPDVIVSLLIKPDQRFVIRRKEKES